MCGLRMFLPMQPVLLLKRKRGLIDELLFEITLQVGFQLETKLADSGCADIPSVKAKQ
jgi:hypothetical protein